MKKEANHTANNKTKFMQCNPFKYNGNMYVADTELGHVRHIHTSTSNRDLIIFHSHEANIGKIATLCVYVYNFVIGTQVKIKLRFADMDFESCKNVREKE